MRLAIALLASLLVSLPLQAQCPPGGCPAPGYGSSMPILQGGGWRNSPPVMRPQPRPQPRPQARPAQKSHPAIVKVGSSVTGTGYATGTIIDRRDGSAYVLTASHLTGDSHFVIAGGKRYDATVHKNDPSLDVAVLKITDPGIKPVHFAEQAPSLGDRISFWGWGDHYYKCTSGPLMSRVGTMRDQDSSVQGDKLDLDWMRMEARGRNGDSGAAFLNAKGRIVGVLSSTHWCSNVQHRGTVGCCFPRLRMFLRGILPPYPNRPGVIIPRPPRPVVVLPGPPVLPMPPPTNPLPQPPVPPAATDLVERVTALEAKLDLVLAKLDELQGQEGPPGADGTDGKDGEDGEDGEDGSSAAVDIDVVTAAVIARLADEPLFYVTHKNPTTGELIPQRDPKTGEMVGTQVIKRGDHYTIYIYKNSDLQALSP